MASAFQESDAEILQYTLSELNVLTILIVSHKHRTSFKKIHNSF